MCTCCFYLYSKKHQTNRAAGDFKTLNALPPRRSRRGQALRENKSIKSELQKMNRDMQHPSFFSSSLLGIKNPFTLFKPKSDSWSTYKAARKGMCLGKMSENKSDHSGNVSSMPWTREGEGKVRGGGGVERDRQTDRITKSY